MARFRAMPYAKALLDVVREQQPGREEEVAEELERVRDVARAVPDLERVLVTPVLTQEAKARVLDEALDTLAVSELVRRFMHVVQRHYRVEHLAAIAETYRDLLDRMLGRVRARVEVVGQLDAGQQRALTEAVAERVGAVVTARFVDRPELLGGFRVQVGSKVFDGSLVGQLEQLRRNIAMEQG